MSPLAIGMFGLVGAVLLVVLLFLVRDVFTKMSGSGVILVLGLLVLFVGERVLGVGDLRLPVSGVGVLILAGALGLRGYALVNSRNARRHGHRLALGWSLVVLGGVAMYGLTLEPVVTALGFDEAAAPRWIGVWSSLFPILLLLGIVPIFQVDRLLAVHPVLMPAGASRAAQVQGVIAALAIALAFPVNYLAKQKEVVWDVAYFRTTRPGESTKAMVSTAAQPVEAILFFPAGNDVGREVLPYFEQLARASNGMLTTRMVDQALDPKIAEELKIRDNGQIVLKQGESNEKFKLDTDIDRAKRDLRKLDSMVQKHLMKLTRGQRTVYFLTGHGEANWRDGEDPLRKIALYKKEILEAQNFKVKTYGVADGSSIQVPDDADTVIVAAPTEPLLPEEVEALKVYFDKGGSLMVLVDPQGDPLTDLLAFLGVEAGRAQLGNLEAHARATGGPADNVFIATNKYGSHAAVKTLSRNSQVAHMVFPGAVFVQKAGETANKVTTLVRSMPNTFSDDNGNFLSDSEEAKKVYELAVAVTKDVGEGDAKTEARAIVVGDVGFLSDDPIRALKANAQFGYDSVRWTSRDEDISGEVESEEDVKVQHTRNEDWAWFLLAVLAVPFMVLGVGTLSIQMRQRRKS